MSLHLSAGQSREIKSTIHLEVMDGGRMMNVGLRDQLISSLKRPASHRSLMNLGETARGEGPPGGSALPRPRCQINCLVPRPMYTTFSLTHKNSPAGSRNNAQSTAGTTINQKFARYYISYHFLAIKFHFTWGLQPENAHPGSPRSYFIRTGE